MLIDDGGAIFQSAAVGFPVQREYMDMDEHAAPDFVPLQADSGETFAYGPFVCGGMFLRLSTLDPYYTGGVVTASRKGGASSYAY